MYDRNDPCNVTGGHRHILFHNAYVELVTGGSSQDMTLQQSYLQCTHVVDKFVLSMSRGWLG